MYSPGPIAREVYRPEGLSDGRSDWNGSQGRALTENRQTCPLAGASGECSPTQSVQDAALLDGTVVPKIPSFDDFLHRYASLEADPVGGC